MIITHRSVSEKPFHIKTDTIDYVQEIDNCIDTSPSR
jgi:hypothetical protein